MKISRRRLRELIKEQLANATLDSDVLDDDYDGDTVSYPGDGDEPVLTIGELNLGEGTRRDRDGLNEDLGSLSPVALNSLAWVSAVGAAPVIILALTLYFESPAFWDPKRRLSMPGKLLRKSGTLLRNALLSILGKGAKKVTKLGMQVPDKIKDVLTDDFLKKWRKEMNQNSELSVLVKRYFHYTEDLRKATENIEEGMTPENTWPTQDKDLLGKWRSDPDRLVLPRETPSEWQSRQEKKLSKAKRYQREVARTLVTQFGALSKSSIDTEMALAHVRDEAGPGGLGLKPLDIKGGLTVAEPGPGGGLTVAEPGTEGGLTVAEPGRLSQRRQKS